MQFFETSDVILKTELIVNVSLHHITYRIPLKNIHFKLKKNITNIIRCNQNQRLSITYVDWYIIIIIDIFYYCATGCDRV